MTATEERAGGRRGRHAVPSGRVGGASLAVLGVCLLLVVGAGVVEALAPAGPPPAAAVLPQDPATAGTWYCPVTAAAEETAVLSLASVAAAGGAQSTVTVVRYTAEGVVADPPLEIPAAEAADVVLDEGRAAQPIVVRWSGAPVVATWRVEGADSAGAPCAPQPAPHWLLTGFQTNAASRSTLHLFNPFGSDAVARVWFATPEGRVDRVLTESLLVGSGEHLGVDLGEFVPEQPDVGVVVEVLSGRLVAQGEAAFRPTPGTPAPTGRVLLPAAPAPAAEWRFGWAVSADDATSWLVVMNPGEAEAAVELRVSDPLPQGEALLGEVAVPGGSVVRLDLAGASGSPAFGVAVASVNEVPVVVSRLTELRPQGEGVGVAASLGASADAGEWVLAGGGTEGRTTTVALYNPTGEPALATVDASTGTPAEWQELELAANGSVMLDLGHLGPRPAVGVRVRTGAGGVVPELTTRAPGEHARLWSAIGVPDPAWTGPLQRPIVRRNPALATTPVVVRQPDPVPVLRLPPPGEAPGEAPGEEAPGEEAPAD